MCKFVVELVDEFVEVFRPWGRNNNKLSLLWGAGDVRFRRWSRG